MGRKITARFNIYRKEKKTFQTTPLHHFQNNYISRLHKPMARVFFHDRDPGSIRVSLPEKNIKIKACCERGLMTKLSKVEYITLQM